MARYLKVVTGHNGDYLGINSSYSRNEGLLAFPSSEWDRESVFEAMWTLQTWLTLNPAPELDPEVEADD